MASFKNSCGIVKLGSNAVDGKGNVDLRSVEVKIAKNANSIATVSSASESNKLAIDKVKSELTTKVETLSKSTSDNFIAVQKQATNTTRSINNKVKLIENELRRLDTLSDELKALKQLPANFDMSEVDRKIGEALQAISPVMLTNAESIDTLRNDLTALASSINDLMLPSGVTSEVTKVEFTELKNQLTTLATKIFDEVDKINLSSEGFENKLDNLRSEMLKEIGNAKIITLSQKDIDALETKLTTEINKLKSAYKPTKIHVVLSRYPNGINPSTNKTEFTVNAKEGKYLGLFASADASPPNQASLYKWVKVGGEKGDTGDRLYTHIRYARTANGFDTFNRTTSFTTDPDKSYYIGIQQNSTSSVPSDNHHDYNWSTHFSRNTQFIHVVYSKYFDGKNPLGALDGNYTDDDIIYMGIAITSSPHKPIDPDAYKWNRITGHTPKTVDKLYHHIAFSKFESGKDASGNSAFSVKPVKGVKYLGINSNSLSANPPTDANAYDWVLIGSKGSKGEKGDKGDQGIQGIQGEKGDSLFTHIVYSEFDNGFNQKTNTVDYHKEPQAGDLYIGFRANQPTNDYNLNDSSLYNWFLARGVSGKSLRTYIGFSDFETGVDGQNRFAIVPNYNGQRYMMIAYNSFSLIPPTRPDGYQAKIDLGQLSGKSGGFTQAEVESICSNLTANLIAGVERKITALEEKLKANANTGGSGYVDLTAFIEELGEFKDSDVERRKNVDKELAGLKDAIKYSWIGYGNCGSDKVSSNKEGADFVYFAVNKPTLQISNDARDYDYKLAIKPLDMSTPSLYLPLRNDTCPLIGVGSRGLGTTTQTVSKLNNVKIKSGVSYVFGDSPDSHDIITLPPNSSMFLAGKGIMLAPHGRSLITSMQVKGFAVTHNELDSLPVKGSIVDVDDPSKKHEHLKGEKYTVKDEVNENTEYSITLENATGYRNNKTYLLSSVSSTGSFKFVLTGDLDKLNAITFGGIGDSTFILAKEQGKDTFINTRNLLSKVTTVNGKQALKVVVLVGNKPISDNGIKITFKLPKGDYSDPNDNLNFTVWGLSAGRYLPICKASCGTSLNIPLNANISLLDSFTVNFKAYVKLPRFDKPDNHRSSYPTLLALVANPNERDCPVISLDYRETYDSRKNTWQYSLVLVAVRKSNAPPNEFEVAGRGTLNEQPIEESPFYLDDRLADIKLVYDHNNKKFNLYANDVFKLSMDASKINCTGLTDLIFSPNLHRLVKNSSNSYFTIADVRLFPFAYVN